MSAITYNIWRPQNVILVVVITALINMLLFIGLPWLTRVSEREKTKKIINLTLLTPRRPPKTPESEKEKRLRQEELKQAPKLKTQTRSTQQQMNVPKFGFEIGQGGFGSGVSVEFDTGEFGLDMDEFGFSLSQVDKAPRPVRKILPVYPFSAKRRGIKARVLIRALVDKNGDPQKVVAAECDPEDALDIFGPPAVEAFQKWRFTPGEIGGDPVPTRVAVNLFFELD
jgi:protein TonB